MEEEKEGKIRLGFSVSPLRHKIIPLVYPAPSNYHMILYIMLHVYSPDYLPHGVGGSGTCGEAGSHVIQTLKEEGEVYLLWNSRLV